MKYSSFYFMHIAKTGGRHILDSLIIPIYDSIKIDNKIDIIYSSHLKESDPRFSLKDKFQRHACWKSEIKDDTYVVTILRDPVETIVSIFSQMYQFNNNNLTAKDKVIDKNKFIDIDKSLFLEWLTKDNIHHNFQFKNFTRTNNEFLSNEIGRERVKSTSLLLDFKHIGNNDYVNKAYNRICLDLGIHQAYDLNISLNDDLFNPLSRILFEKLDSSDIDLIRDIMSLDVELYESNELNWL